MKKIFNQRNLLILSLVIILSLFAFLQVDAQALDVGLDEVVDSGLTQTDIRVTLARIIRAFLGLLGVVAVSILLYGGFLYMTSSGEIEKIQKAKKLLMNAGIGLVIILSAFAITSFVLSRLSGSSGVSGGCDACSIGVTVSCTADASGCYRQKTCNDNGCWGSCYKADDDCGSGRLITTYCPNPSYTDSKPWLCSTPATGNYGRTIKVTAGNIGPYHVGDDYGRIYFKKIISGESTTLGYDSEEYPAEVVRCNESDDDWFTLLTGQNLSDGQGVVRINVPEELNSEDSYYIVASPAGDVGSGVNDNILVATYRKSWVPVSSRKDVFNLSNAPLGPEIKCFVNESDEEIFSAVVGDTVKVKGARFGESFGQVRYTQIAATLNDWSDILIETTIPDTISGNVVVYDSDDNNNDEDENYFAINCTENNDCVSNCCKSIGWDSDVCVDARYCLSDVGENCFDEPTCSDVGGCLPGLYCDTNESPCVCQSLGVGSPCDSDPSADAPGCQASDDMCAQGFYCSIENECTCQLLPKIYNVDPNDGAAGNFITIFGQGFGTVQGEVFFEDSLENKVEVKYPTLICSGLDIWQDDQVIVEIPPNILTLDSQYEISLINVDDEIAIWDDGYFTYNNTSRPALCGVDPIEGEYRLSVSIDGKNFGDEGDGKVFIGGEEFDKGDSWSWSDGQINDALVPNIRSSLNLPVQVKSEDNFSNKVYFDVLSHSKTPIIDYINPTQGPAGQYITIFGSNFGNKVGQVKFDDGNAEIDNWKISDPLPSACANDYWHDTYITVKVPSLSVGETKIVVIDYDEIKSAEDEEDAYIFTVCNESNQNCPLSPGICAITPSQGPVGLDNVEIYGDNLGSTDGQINFGDQIINSVLSWEEDKVTGIIVPENTIPSGASSGFVDVNIINNGQVSNKVLFEVNDCRDDESICTGDDICCETDGVCKEEALCQTMDTPECTYSWGFSTGEAVGVEPPPRVVEKKYCETDPQSPSPYIDSTNNCVNALVSARFTQAMDGDTLNTTNIIVSGCNQDPNNNGVDIESCTTLITTSQAIGIISGDDGPAGFIYYPTNNFEASTWYQVSLNGQLGGIKSAQGLILDGDSDGEPGGNYVWHFRIRESANICPLEKVMVNPSSSYIYRFSETQDYNANAIASECNLIDPGDYNWTWYKNYTEGNTIIREEATQLINERGIAKIEARTDNTNEFEKVAIPNNQGIVNVGVEVFPGDDRYKNDDDNLLVVDLNIPEIYEIYPDNGLVYPGIDSYITVLGRNFGNEQGTSIISFGNTIAQMSDCADPWSDTRIQVKVPQAIYVSHESAKTYIIPSVGKKTGMILFYDFADNSKVIVDDKVSNYNAEYKGTYITKVKDTFGQAMKFDGSSNYISMPNEVFLSNGSLEIWFKPQEEKNQTLFSFSNGSNDIFSIDIDSGNKIKIVSESGNNVMPIEVKQNDWNHLVYTYEDGSYGLYLNGYRFSGSSSEFFDGVTERAYILIGAKKVGSDPSDYFKGVINSVALYSQVLSFNQVQEYYGLNSGQILLMHFESTGLDVKDYSINNFDNFSIGDVTKEFRTDYGRFGKAVKFANDNNITINNNLSLAFNRQATIEGWFNVPDQTGTKAIYESGSFRLAISGGRVIFTVNINGTEKYAQSDNATNPNEWNYFAGVYDGQSIKINLNGEVTEYSDGTEGIIYQPDNFYNAWIGGATNNFNGQLDEIAIYSRALSLSEQDSRLGAKNGSFINVKTSFGEDTSDDPFIHSENVYPFICQLAPDSGKKGTNITVSGNNFGDSNITTYNGQQYGVGSNVNFYHSITDVINPEEIKKWQNKVLGYFNPFSDLNQPIIEVSVSIDPYSEPYNDTDLSGNYTIGDPGEDFADLFTEGGSEDNYDKYEYNDGVQNLTKLESNRVEYYSNPVITSISPDNGAVGQWITIQGYNFGDTEGQVFFYPNDNEAELAPCEVGRWNDGLVIVVVPAEAKSGRVYLKTLKGLDSNDVNFDVNNKPIGPGLCRLTDELGDTKTHGEATDIIFAEGVRFNDENDQRGDGQFIFTKNRFADVVSWNNASIEALIPMSTVSGDVYVTKRVESGRECAGFSIGDWCPSNQYDIIYEDVPSNPLPLQITEICTTGRLGQAYARDAGFPIHTTDSEGNNFDELHLGLIGTDGTYLYTMASAHQPTLNYGAPGDNKLTIYKTGTGYHGTELGVVYNKYQFDKSAYSNYSISNFYRYTLGSMFTDYENNGIRTMTVTSDGIYLGMVVYTAIYNYPNMNNLPKGYLAKVNLDEACEDFECSYDISWQELSELLIANDDASLPQKLEDAYDSLSYFLYHYSNFTMTSNGNDIFVLSYDLPGGDIKDLKGYTVQILNKNLKQKSLFTVENAETKTFRQWYKAFLTNRFVADDQYLYIGVNAIRQVINWKSKTWESFWWNCSNYSMEYFGQYDWVNKKYWFGSYKDSKMPDGEDNWWLGTCKEGITSGTDHNRIYRYSKCDFNDRRFCLEDSDCDACGRGTSRCLNGICSPYIKSFTPTQGPIGTWMTIEGCYFACDPGEVWFAGKNENDQYFDYYRQGIKLGPECIQTWKCSDSGYDQIIVEVPDERTEDLIDDAVTGPVGIWTYDNIYDDTTDLDTPNFTVNNDPKGPQICRISPEYGNRGKVVKVIGENFGEKGAYDYIKFTPKEPPVGETLREPFFDENDNNEYDNGEGFIDLSNPGIYDYSLSPEFFTYEIDEFIDSDTKPYFCPDDGWNDYEICFEVPEGAGGYGTNDGKALDDVTVHKIIDSTDISSNEYGFDVTFGSCGNQVYENNKGEQCDGTDLPSDITCEYLGWVDNSSCTFKCDSSCDLLVCDVDTGDCEEVINLICGNGILESIEECDDLNTADGDGCSSSCKIEPDPNAECGNDEQEFGEGCDGIDMPGGLVCSDPPFNYSVDDKACIGGTDATDLCTDNTECDDDNCDSCFFECDDCALLVCDARYPNDCEYVLDTSCGDNVVQTEYGEECDDGNTVDGDRCSSSCKDEAGPNAYCGNNERDSGEECDGTNIYLTKTCSELEYPSDKICSGGNDAGDPCEDVADCDSGSSCVDSCVIECTTLCKLKVCSTSNGDDCEFVADILCGDGTIDTDDVNEECDCGDPDEVGYACVQAELDGQECDDHGFEVGALSCYPKGHNNQCKFDISDCDDNQYIERPIVSATVPGTDSNFENFCANGIINIYFNQEINTETINKDNILIEECNGSVVIKPQKKGIVYFFKNIFRKLLGLENKIYAQAVCSALSSEDYTLISENISGQTVVSLTTNDLLKSGQDYKIIVKGDEADGTTGIKNLFGKVLDNMNDSEAGTIGKTPIYDSSNPYDYIFGFKTLGDPADALSGVCDVGWIDVSIYSKEYSPPDATLDVRDSELRNNDLFICAGKNDCDLEVDYDQDPNTSGNQHIYVAKAMYSGDQELKATFKWSKNNVSDPKKALTIYNTDVDGDTDQNPSVVHNETGVVYTTAKAFEEAIAKLVIEAQAIGTISVPAQKEFIVYILLCENPWPSINEKFPISSIINAYNFQTFYCRDAGRSGDTSDDLPAARWLAPKELNLKILQNNGFEFGNLTYWADLNVGTAYQSQPIFSDVNFSRIGETSDIQGAWWVNTRERYRGGSWENIDTIQGNTPRGVLQSSAFIIEGDEIMFKVGGTSNIGWPLGEVTEVVALDNEDIMGVTAVILGVKDDSMTGFDVVAQATGSGDVGMTETSFNTSAYTLGRDCSLCDGGAGEYGECVTNDSGISQCSAVAGIIYIYDNATAGYISFDDLKQFSGGIQKNIRF